MARRLAAMSRRLAVSKSRIIKECLLVRLSAGETEVSPFELGRDLFGRYASGNPSGGSRRILKGKIRAKNFG